MGVCSGCGASNDDNRTKCEYCGSAIGGGSTTLVIDWSASTHEGARANGRVSLEAPAGVDSEKVRAGIESAYSSAIDALGPGSTQDQIRDALWERLEALLPPDHRLKDLTVASHGVDAEPSSKTNAGCSLFALLLSAVAGVCFLCGVFGIWMRSDFAGQIADLEAIPIVAHADAAQATGLVCLESVAVSVDEPLVVPETELRCIYYKGGSSVEERVPSFQAAGLTVDTVGLKFHKPPDLGAKSPHGGQWIGFDVDKPVTLVGEVRDGAMRGGATFLISHHPSREALIAQLHSDQNAGTAFAWICSLLGLVLFLPAGYLITRRRG